MKQDIKTSPTPEQQLALLIAKLEPADQKLVQSVRKLLAKRFPTANELVYDYSRAFVISWSPSEAGADAVVALCIEEAGNRFVFNNGKNLPDPNNILQGKATLTRYIPVGSIKDLQRPEVEAMMDAAEEKLRVALPKSRKGKLVVKESKKK